MISRTIIINQASYLSVKNQQLMIQQNDTVVGRVPLEDVGLLMLESPQIVLTHALLQACWRHEVTVVSCDERHTPCAILHAFDHHAQHALVLQQQIQASVPRQKRLWASIVQHKIKAQAHVLRQWHDASVLMQMVDQVKSGDSSNQEAQAARWYWQHLLGETFRREGRDSTDAINAVLNYGYAVLRAMVARAVVGAGLHPALGVFHCNQFNAFNLVDDLIEPIRPLVDALVKQCHHNGEDLTLDRALKQRIYALAEHPIKLQGRDDETVLMTALQRYCASVRDYLAGDIASVNQVAIPSI